MELPENKLTDFIKADEKAKWMPINNHNIKVFTEDEIRRITKNYSTPIGKGGFGEVYRGTLDDGSPVAVKKYILRQNLKEGFAKEMTVHSQINHKNVVRLLGYCSEENALVMVTEFISRGTLREHLHGSDDPVSLDARLSIAIDCANALGYMHSSMYQPVIHGDIKPDNILLDDNFGARLSDFGISRLVFNMDKTQQHTMNIIGSRGYIDPEHLESGLVDPKNDVYSFGVVLLELITRTKAADDGKPTVLVSDFTLALREAKQRKAREMYDAEIANNASNMKVLDKIGKLASECLTRDIRERPDMNEVAERLRMLRKVHREQGQQKTGQWSLWGKQDKVNEQDTSFFSSSSNSSMFSNLNSMGIFNRRRRLFQRNGGLLIEQMGTLRICTEKEVRKVTENYSHKIGIGVFGQVYKGMHEDNTVVAVRRYSIQNNIDFVEKVVILSRFSHQNVIKLLGLCLETDDPLLIHEYASRGSVYDILHSTSGDPSLRLRLDIAIGSAHALAYLHSENSLHGDITSRHILLDDHFVPKISSMAGVLYPTSRWGISADIRYIDPVYVHTGDFTTKSDVYSFGVVLLELITRKQAQFSEDTYLNVEIVKIWKSGGRAMFDDKIAVDGKSIAILEEMEKIAMECLKENIDDRPEMTKVARQLQELQHRLEAQPTRGAQVQDLMPRRN